MQLRVARLCLDCEEVHDAQHCPVCASETFVFLTRWVVAPERRTKPRPPDDEVTAARQAEARQAVQRPSGKAMIGYGVVGLGVLGLGRWLLKGRQKIESAGISGAGELK
jgi:hypothetical protein